MLRNITYGFAILLGLAAVQASDWQAPLLPGSPPSVSVLLPPSIASETVQIAYQLTGPFGAYGTHTDPLPGLPSYEIDAALDSKAAKEIRMIVYASGCEIQTFVIPLKADSTLKQEFECQHVPTVPLSGHIMPIGRLRNKNNVELDVSYVAAWGDKFFNIYDGRVPEFKAASVRPDARGRFQVKLPYFSVDSKPSEPQSSYQSSFRLTLCDSDTGNLIASDLEPERSDFTSETRELRIRSFYPDGLKFNEEPSDSPGPQVETPDDLLPALIN